MNTKIEYIYKTYRLTDIMNFNHCFDEVYLRLIYVAFDRECVTFIDEIYIKGNIIDFITNPEENCSG